MARLANILLFPIAHTAHRICVGVCVRTDGSSHAAVIINQYPGSHCILTLHEAWQDISLHVLQTIAVFISKAVT